MYKSREIVIEDNIDCTALRRLLDNMRAVMREVRESRDRRWRLFCHLTSKTQEGSIVVDSPGDFPNVRTVEVYDIHGRRVGSDGSEPIGLLVMKIDYRKDRHVSPTIKIAAAGAEPADECFDAVVEIASYILGKPL